jgi:two-component system LytT family response regulator/two-component system response regulator LytT
MTVKILVADDENHICLELAYILEQMKDVELVATCSTGDGALENICKLKPDIVFLDIDMPGLNGIKLGHYLNNIEKTPYIIYVTAYDKFTVEAIKVGAKAYLLKPFSEEDVKEELNTAIKYFENRENVINPIKQIPISKNRFTRISGEINGKFYMLDQEDILIIYAKNRSVFIKANNKNYFSNFTLSQLEKRLQPDIFFRCHRNYIINLYKIKEVVPWFNSTYLLIMDDDKTEVPVSRTNVKQLKELLGL